MIYRMLVLFTCCWGSNSSIQADVVKLNGDRLQPSGIRYEVWSFSVRRLISIAYWKGLISRVKLSVVVPQAIGISLHNRNGDSAREFLVIVLWGLISWHSMYLNFSLSLLFLCRVWGHVCLVEPDWCEFSLSLSIYLGFVHLFLPVCAFVTYNRVYTRVHCAQSHIPWFLPFVQDSGLLGECC